MISQITTLPRRRIGFRRTRYDERGDGAPEGGVTGRACGGSGGIGGAAPLPFADPKLRLFWVVRIYEKSPGGDARRIPKLTAVASRFYAPRMESSAAPEARGGRGGSRPPGVGAVEDVLREAGALHHVRQLLVDDVPAPGAQAAVGVDLDALRAAQRLDGVEDAVADELGRLDEVRVDVEHSETDARVPVLGEEGERVRVAGPVLVLRA